VKVWGTPRLALSLSVVALLFGVASRKVFFADTISSPFLSIALLSVFLILLRTRASRAELLVVALLFSAFALCDIKILGYPTSWPVWASFLGISSLAVLGLRAIGSEGKDRRFALWTFVPAFLFVASEWTASYFLDWTEKMHPKVLDLYLYSFDASLHVQFSFAVGRLFARFPLFAQASLFIYIGLPIAIGLVYAGCLMQDQKSALPALLAFLMTGPVGVLCYNLVPALGPVHIFLQDFPWHPLSSSQAARLFLEPIPAAGPRNAIPSLHFAWILLVVWYTRRLTLLEKTAAAAFLVLTFCATLGTGEHYFVDLVVAVPFSVAIVSLADLVTGRIHLNTIRAFVVGAVTTAAWLLALRFTPRVFWVSPFLSWAFCAGTVTISWLVARAIWAALPTHETTTTAPLGPTRDAARQQAPVITSVRSDLSCGEGIIDLPRVE